MSGADIADVIEKDHRALAAFVKGDPEPKKAMFSRRDDVTLANPFGPPARGWDNVERTLEHASAQLRDGEALGFDRISGYTTPDLAYIVEIEHYRGKVGSLEEVAPNSLRVTTIFRREDGEWKIAHRHADAITSSREPESIVDR
jgi:ketosteroid isomerase-like protein